jgi:hypothetical protein
MAEIGTDESEMYKNCSKIQSQSLDVMLLERSIMPNIQLDQTWNCGMKIGQFDE